MQTDSRIKVIDSATGSGKTSCMIDYINDLSLEQKVIYITPLLTECQRIQDYCNRDFIQPDASLGHGKKRNHFLDLIKRDENIVSTHVLFSMMDEKVIDALKEANYMLILDEVFQVVDTYRMWQLPSFDGLASLKENLTRRNIEMLIAKNFIKVDEKTFKVNWIEKEFSADRYADIKELTDRGMLYFVRNSLLLWTFPHRVFLPDVFKKIYVLTYLFESQLQKHYYDYFEIDYELFHIEENNGKYTIIKTIDQEYDIAWRKKVKILIHILDNPKLNQLGDTYMSAKGLRHTALCHRWYKENPHEIKQIKNNIINFFQNIAHTKGDERMWTCFKADKLLFRDKNLSINDKKYWVAMNTRATNDFSHKTALAYVLNVYPNPMHSAFFESKNIKIDQDKYATSMLIQWIWRSAVRNGEEIQLYLPSERMRKLLKDFLDVKDLEHTAPNRQVP